MCQETKGILIKDWEDFEEKIVKGTEETFQSYKEKSDIINVSPPLYRGQADAKWELETTLERFLGKNIFVEEYYRLIRRIKPIIESCTSNHWQLPEVEDDLKELDGHDTISMPSYEFMAYLRHNQFPSPLLDWTLSPYVAAFFAFNEDKKTEPAIYSYFSDVGEGKRWCSDIPKICFLGKYVNTHKRHHLQQSEYTFCVRGGDEGVICRTDGVATEIKALLKSRYTYASHEKSFSIQENLREDGTDNQVSASWIGRGKQDILKKYILPYSQRKNFLNKLNQMNINAYSLFGNEEGLIHKLAIEELLLKDL